LSSGEDGVNPEYISAYKKQRSEHRDLRQRRRPFHARETASTIVGSSDGHGRDPRENADVDPEDNDEEANDDTKHDA
jgi:hypothetical protein